MDRLTMVDWTKPREVEALAERVIGSIDDAMTTTAPGAPGLARLYEDRLRVLSDLAGLRYTAETDRDECHAARYADGLRRTAALYGVGL